MPRQSTSKCRHFGSRLSLVEYGQGPDVMSNQEHNDSAVRLFTCITFVGKAEKVVRKIASQVHCKGDVATEQTYRRYCASCHTNFI